MSDKDGGPAFAAGAYEHNSGGYLAWQDGMSLRDYFAAKAMQGLLAQSCGTALGSDPVYGAQYAYQMADAMLAVREGSTP